MLANQILRTEYPKIEQLLSSNEKCGENASRFLNCVEKAIEQEPLFFKKENALGILEIFRTKSFLESLSLEERYRCANASIKIIELSNYNLLDIFETRVAKYSQKTLFRSYNDGSENVISYESAYRTIRKIAALFFKLSIEPRVILLCDNSPLGAMSDLACLLFDILVSPINPQLDFESLHSIFDKIKPNIVCVDNSDRLSKVETLSNKINRKINIVYLGKEDIKFTEKNIFILQKEIGLMSSYETQNFLGLYKRKNIKDIKTIMFTSGSSGFQKGVCFSDFNLTSKRFARGAALPFVGDDNVFVSYLPLYHTFGRYLELLGTIYWGGEYVFVGNPSLENLLEMFKIFKPTGFISVPIRWLQLRDYFFEKQNLASEKDEKKLFEEIFGNRFKWGLSAAGYLEPSVFYFFRKMGIELLSGFGMTEATGGITMTPPGEYVKESVGKPLPGIETKLSSENELMIRGPYVAVYLDGETFDEEGWLKTGDLFEIIENGHYKIVDRIKDIYKNVKGQTIAPRKAESLLENSPGIKRAFLTGDGEAYCCVMIYPNYEDNFIKNLHNEEKLEEYIRALIVEANKSLSPHERIVNFLILEKDFSFEKGEITPKGTYNRKKIKENYKDLISSLYQAKSYEFNFEKTKLIFPSWLIRDMGITLNDLRKDDFGIQNKSQKKYLRIKTLEDNRILIGDFIYTHKENAIDLGTIIRQPLLWGGNFSLMDFCKCKENWETKFENFSSQIILDDGIQKKEIIATSRDTLKNFSLKMSEILELILISIYERETQSLAALESLKIRLKIENYLLSELIRRRIEALANHPDFAVRNRAYKIMLADEPEIDYSKYLPAFLKSGKPFLDEDSIIEISEYGFEKIRLENMRLRMDAYRKGITWPASDVIVQQLKSILDILYNIGLRKIENYPAIRAEFVSWLLFDKCPELSQYALELYRKLANHFEESFINFKDKITPTFWEENLVFLEDISQKEREKIKKVLSDGSFLKEAIALIYDDFSFELSAVAYEGIWVAKLLSSRSSMLYRLSVKTKAEKHYDIMLFIKEDLKEETIRKTLYWMIKLSYHPSGFKIFPRFGNYRSKHGAATLAYVNELSIWDKIKEYATTRISESKESERIKWKKFFVRGFSSIFLAWDLSDRKIIPGLVSPFNATANELDFVERAKILSLSGWDYCDNPLEIVKQILKNFYRQTIAFYPYVKNLLNIEWIFDAIIEAFGYEQSKKIFNELEIKSKNDNVYFDNIKILDLLQNYLQKIEKNCYVHLSVELAKSKYEEWLSSGFDYSNKAKADFVEKLSYLYQIYKYEKYAIFVLYRDTYFKDCSEKTRKAFDRLISAIAKNKKDSPAKLYELLELFDILEDRFDKSIIASISFYKTAEFNEPLLFKVGDSSHPRIEIKTVIKDSNNKKYYVRQAVSPSEVGALYRLFVQNDYPINIASENNYLLVFEDIDGYNLIGGLCYTIINENAANLEGLVIASAYREKRLGGALLEDFCQRLAADGYKAVLTYYTYKKFFEKYGFKIDPKWGGLVRLLDKKHNIMR